MPADDITKSYIKYLRDVGMFRKKEGIVYLDIKQLKTPKTYKLYPIPIEEMVIYIRNFPSCVDSKFYLKFQKEQKKLVSEYQITKILISDDHEVDFSFIIPEIKSLYMLDGCRNKIENLHNDLESIFIDCRTKNVSQKKSGYYGRFDNLPCNLQSFTILSDTYYDFSNLPTNLKIFRHFFESSITLFNYDFLPDTIEEMYIYQICNPDEYVFDNFENCYKTFNISHLSKSLQKMTIKEMNCESIIFNGNSDFWNSLTKDFQIHILTYSTDNHSIDLSKDYLLHTYRMHLLMHGTSINHFHLKTRIYH